MSRDIELKNRWEQVQALITNRFGHGEEMDLDAIIFLIGVQELGAVARKFKKDEKLALMHIAICRLLEPYGFYKYSHTDAEGWPHYSVVEQLPQLKPGEQSLLMKEAIVQYFDEHGFFDKP